MDAPPGTVDDDGISPAELRLAARNHALPLEALRYDITPAGLHYLLIHYDIPAVDAAVFRLEVGGAAETPISLSLDELKARERVAMPITFECAGKPLRPLLEEAGVQPDAVEVLFAGLDSGFEGGERQDYERALSLADAE